MTLEQIAPLLSAFGVMDTPKALEPLLHYDGLTQQPPAFKLVARVTFAHRAPLILRLLKEQRSPAPYLEEQAALAALYAAHGLPTSVPMPAPGGLHHLVFPVQGHPVLATLEDDLGPEVTALSLPLCRQAGQLLGRMHSAAAQAGFHMAYGKAIFDFETGSDVDGGPMLSALLHQHNRQPEAAQAADLYQDRRRALLAGWASLPRYGVQGDLSINNLTLAADDTLQFFDYNCAGEAVLISDAVLQGLLLAREMDYPADEQGVSPRQRFSAFFLGYVENRPLTKQEEAVWPKLYQVMDAFWFTRVRFAADSLEKQLEQQPEMPLAPFMRALEHRLTRPAP